MVPWKGRTVTSLERGLVSSSMWSPSRVKPCQPSPPRREAAGAAEAGKARREQVSGGGDQPQCFYGGAFPQHLRTRVRRNVRGLSPKAKSGDESSAPTRWESRLSLCVSFDSDLLDEGDLGGKKREEREEGSEVLEA